MAINENKTKRVNCVQRKRLFRAVMGVVFAGVLVFLGDVVYKSVRSASLLNPAQPSPISNEGGAWERFSSEALDLSRYSEVRIHSEGSVVGFTTPLRAEDAFRDMAGCLERGGWTAVPSGVATEGTFIKSSGEYTWLYISCIQMGDSTSVVVQCALTHGKD